MATPVSTSASSVAIAQGLPHGRFESVEPLLAGGADGDRFSMVSPQHVQIGSVGHLVGLVQHEQGRVVFEAKLGEHGLDGLDLALGLGARCINDVQKQVGLTSLLERGLERRDQGVRQVADETNRIREQPAAAAAEPPPPGARVQCREQLVLDQHAGLGEGVHERALARVGITDQRDRRDVIAAGDFALLPRLDLGELRLQLLDPVRHQPAVFLELLFARTAHADAALVTRKVGPHPLQPGHGVLELCQLDLKVGLVRPGMRGEDVEDHLGPVDDLDLELLLEVARLRRPQVVVKDYDVGLVRVDQQP